LPAGGQLYLAPDPALWDFLGGFTSMAINVLYTNVRVDPLPATAESLTVEAGRPVCALAYRDGHYTRLAPTTVSHPATPGR
jgi:hypothetical protein